MASEWENRGGIISEMHSAWTPSSAQFGHADWSGPKCYVVAEKAIEATRGEPETGGGFSLLVKFCFRKLDGERQRGKNAR